ncbi:MAG: hypothetical protein KA535_03675 [Azonexus sp.]|nr:hypothetical protein [Azonexus sp.]
MDTFIAIVALGILVVTLIVLLAISYDDLSKMNGDKLFSTMIGFLLGKKLQLRLFALNFFLVFFLGIGLLVYYKFAN